MTEKPSMTKKKRAPSRKGDFEDTFFVIMAGGKGERFWPLSTGRAPKPFVNLTGLRTLIEWTVNRAKKLVPLERILIVVEENHLAAAKKCVPELPESNFIVEPAGRDTAPCIGLAALAVRERNPDAVMVVLPSDHYVGDTGQFIHVIEKAVVAARQGRHIMTIGIMPDRAETGYGYIKTGKRAADYPGVSCFDVTRFVEKPTLAAARRYLHQGGYYWNAGIFVWRIDVLMDGFKMHMPELHAGLVRIDAAREQGEHRKATAIFSRLEKISIDYGLLEKADNIRMIPGTFGWDDVGTWTSLIRVLPGDERGNVSRGETLLLDTKDCVVVGKDIPVATLGVSGLVIIASDKGVLVCDASRSQDVREIARFFTKTKGTKTSESEGHSS